MKKQFVKEMEVQLAKLYNEIEKRKLHSKLYNVRQNELVSFSGSLRWIKNGNIRLREEDQHCNKSAKNLDYLTTRFEEILRYDCLKLHNELIKLETRIKTYGNIQNIRLDIFIWNKRLNGITLVEVGITSQDCFKTYNTLENELNLIYKCSVEIMPYVVTWVSIIIIYHRSII
ncbi:hypothetical protein CWI38_0136p0080 [Hamiltosporidium tvaerminnensis]|uniref:Uncharacterized protein n=1 Tax=Hamiltosporidium tvaerminnensis TaxID=1176355 RepID=A0A4Q9M3C8_9MICR|nr:hypothetical protein CWI38_0136p0080 [Hamiltosporidium tvaerminnensis]